VCRRQIGSLGRARQEPERLTREVLSIRHAPAQRHSECQDDQHRPFNRPPDAELTSVSAGQPWCRPPAGIEPATPSLPSMRQGFTTPHSASRPHTTTQVRGAAEDRVVGRREAAHSAVSGKSLARAPGWSSMGTNADANRPSSPRPQATGSSDATLSITMHPRRGDSPAPSAPPAAPAAAASGRRTDPAGDLVLNRAISRCGCGWRAAWVQAERHIVAGCAVKRCR
jgi:hypothetical protein